MYWTDRKARLDAEMMKQEKTLFDRMRKYYRKQAALLDKEISAYYGKYGTNNVIEYRKLLESLSDADRDLLMQKMDDFAIQYPQYAHLLPVRESIYKLNRLEGLRQSIAMQQLEMGAYEQKQAQRFFEQMALRYASGAAEQMGYGTSFYRFDHDMAKVAVGNAWCEGQDFSSRIWNNRRKLARTLQTDIANSLIRGDSCEKASRILRKKFTKVSTANIERLVFTEDSYLSNEAAMQVFAKDEDFRYYEFLCTGDSHTCDICRSMNGQRFEIAKRQPGVNFPPMHPWCRCFFNPVFRNENGLTSEGESGRIEADLLMKPVNTEEPVYNELLTALETKGVMYNPVHNQSSVLSDEAIIAALGGGDLTKGSCASLGLAYIGQKQGWDVLDFRDGDSRIFFSRAGNLRKLSEATGMTTLKAKGASALTVGNRLLKQCELGKEYYLCVGRHASIVRKTQDGILQYLELQSKNPGWIDFNGNARYTLAHRFGCSQKSDNGASAYFDFMIDIKDSDFSTDEFRSLLGFINTSKSDQRKGTHGTIK